MKPLTANFLVFFPAVHSLCSIETPTTSKNCLHTPYLLFNIPILLIQIIQLGSNPDTEPSVSSCLKMAKDPGRGDISLKRPLWAADLHDRRETQTISCREKICIQMCWRTAFCHGYLQEIVAHLNGLHGNAPSRVSEGMPNGWDQDWLVLPTGQKSDNLSVSEWVGAVEHKPTDTTEPFTGGP